MHIFWPKYPAPVDFMQIVKSTATQTCGEIWKLEHFRTVCGKLSSPHKAQTVSVSSPRARVCERIDTSTAEVWARVFVCENDWWAEVVLAHLHGETSYQREPWESSSLQRLNRTTALAWRMTTLWHGTAARGLISLYLLIHLLTLSLVIIAPRFSTHHSGNDRVFTIHTATHCPQLS